MSFSRFKDNKYKRWYMQIVERSRGRVTYGYTEEHHVMPKSLGGLDTIENVVKLTAREHFICHWLLTKFTWGSDLGSMIYALRMMQVTNASTKDRYSTPITARVFERNKDAYSKEASERLLGEKNPMYGKTHTAETKEKLRKANTGRKQTPEQIEKSRAKRIGKKKTPSSAETKAAAWEKRRLSDAAHRYEDVLTNREMFEYLLDTIHPKQFSHYVKRRLKLWAEIMEETAQYTDIKAVERMFIWYYRYDPRCKYTGNKRAFGTFETGYKMFCGNQDKCECARVNQSVISQIKWDKRNNVNEADTLGE